MIPLAFYAPLKSPTHPNPSGDRAMARALQQALTSAGFAPDLASNLRARDGAGDVRAQIALEANAQAQLPDVIARGRTAGWRVWLTYHNYYKAPDLLGPPAADALGIPYVQIESTRARKRFGGPWDRFAHHAETAAETARVIFHLTHRDAEALRAYAPGGQRIVHLPPFLPRTDLPPKGTRRGGLLLAGMMRPGDKFESYTRAAAALAYVPGPWTAEIAGDGKMRAEVERLMAPFGTRVRFLGALDAGGMQAAYERARALLWPGVNEAFGMVYLEAQAAGVPVVAEDRPGVRDVLPPDTTYPAPEAGPRALAQAITAALETPPDAEALRGRIADHHLLPAAARTLRAILEPLL